MVKLGPKPDYRYRGFMRKNLLKKIIILTAAAGIFFAGCGIEEYYFLPQVPQERINRTSNTEALISAPPIDQFYYALNYTIFYRIYISGYNTSGEIQTASERSSIHSSLSSDYDVIYPHTDPTNTTATTAVNNLFRNRNYFELELEGIDIKDLLSPNGGTIRILFPTANWDIPVLYLNNSTQGIHLQRSGDLISPLPADDLFFRNREDLSNPSNATSTINADVAGRSGLTQRFAYVSMYIAAVGLDPVLFTPIYSKPSHISIFKLPDTN